MCWLSAGPQTTREQPPPNRFKDPYVDIDADNQPCLRLQFDVGTPDLVALSRPTFPGRRRFVATAGLINKYMESVILHGLANLSHSMLWWHRPWPNLGGSERRRQDCEQTLSFGEEPDYTAKSCVMLRGHVPLRSVIEVRCPVP